MGTTTKQAEQLQPVGRRARLRAETVRDIKAIALKHLEEGGASSITLRGIAREMGMTPSALYSYYDTRNDLLAALIEDFCTKTADAQEAALAKVPASDPAGRVLAVGEAFREEAISNPAGFCLVYGEPLKGYEPADGGVLAKADRRSCLLLLGLVDGAWDHVPQEVSGADVAWSDFHPEFADLARESFPHLPPSALAAGLRVWGRMYGLVALEVFGRLNQETRDPRGLYRSELLDLIRSLGLRRTT
ncbi:TetR/AcrR family transcriptional regulator [Streptomyces sp. NPDC059009]|uniref:TetR/AcrR family transcriptional regulator n=1 Tax=Streptomyces sp. NPDC059009 TaxID=3346694 RepID=UPI00367437B6